MTIMQMAHNFALATDEWRNLRRRRASAAQRNEKPRTESESAPVGGKPRTTWLHGAWDVAPDK